MSPPRHPLGLAARGHTRGACLTWWQCPRLPAARRHWDSGRRSGQLPLGLPPPAVQVCGGSCATGHTLGGLDHGDLRPPGLGGQMFRDQGVAGQSSLCRLRVVLPAPPPHSWRLPRPLACGRLTQVSACLAVAPLTLVTVQPSCKAVGCSSMTWSPPIPPVETPFTDEGRLAGPRQM